MGGFGAVGLVFGAISGLSLDLESFLTSHNGFRRGLIGDYLDIFPVNKFKLITPFLDVFLIFLLILHEEQQKCNMGVVGFVVTIQFKLY